MPVYPGEMQRRIGCDDRLDRNEDVALVLERRSPQGNARFVHDGEMSSDYERLVVTADADAHAVPFEGEQSVENTCYVDRIDE